MSTAEGSTSRVLSGVGGWAGIGLAAGLTDPHAGLGAVGGYAALNDYTSLGGALTVFAVPPVVTRPVAFVAGSGVSNLGAGVLLKSRSGSA